MMYESNESGDEGFLEKILIIDRKTKERETSGSSI